MPPLEDDEEEAILLAQIEAAINSYKLKNETRQILHLLYEHNKIISKSLQQFNEVIMIMEENINVIRDPITFSFNFDLPKDVDENFRHETEYIIKSNESSVEIIMKNEIDLYIDLIDLIKIKHGSNIHQYRKLQKK